MLLHLFYGILIGIAAFVVWGAFYADYKMAKAERKANAQNLLNMHGKMWIK